jgi:citrate lyase subunit beta/citryl-CoA lyase
LYLPGSNVRALEKARTLEADGLILDLEDAVAPDAKEVARRQVVTAVGEGGFGNREVVIRVNGLDTPWGGDDLAAVATAGADAVLLPKVSSPDEVLAAVARLDEAGGPADLPLWIMAETPRGILESHAIAGAHPRLAVVVMGTSDLAKELRLPARSDRLGLLGALSHCVLAARAHGLEILDGVHLDLGDEAGLTAACEQGRDLGFDGKTLIHPRQLAAANRVFAPAMDTVERSRRIIHAWTEARDQGRGVVVVDGRLVENLHVEESRRVLALHDAISALGW